MKKLILVVLIMVTFSISWAQNAIITKDGNYTSVITNENNLPTPTGKIYTDLKNKIDYPLYITKRGKLFIFKINTKTGKKYKSYLKLV
jgi:hypothetical protein